MATSLRQRVDPGETEVTNHGRIVCRIEMLFAAADEVRHADVAVEAWWWWGWNSDASAGLFVGLQLRGRTFDYWAGLVRRDRRSCTWRSSRAPVCDRAWRSSRRRCGPITCAMCPSGSGASATRRTACCSMTPTEAWNRAYGSRVPVTFDIEWGAADDPVEIAHGYEQHGDFDARIELTEGVLELVGPARRVHVWGVPYLPHALAMPVDNSGLRGPVPARRWHQRRPSAHSRWVGSDVPSPSEPRHPRRVRSAARRAEVSVVAGTTR